MPIIDAQRALAVLDQGGVMSALRRDVCRFAEGDEHARRRAAVARELAALDPRALRAGAAARAAAAAVPLERLAREVPAAVLLEALQARDPDVAAAVAASRVYLRGEDDAATRRLLRCWPHLSHEVRVARTTIVLQSGEATVALVLAARDRAIPAALSDTPPVPTLRRRAPDGELVEIDVTAIQRAGGPELTFGAGRRPCPGREHALALAAGVLDGLDR